MSDEDLANRANLYADAVIADSQCSTAADIRTELARAFVIGFAAGLEDAARSARFPRKVVRR